MGSTAARWWTPKNKGQKRPFKDWKDYVDNCPMWEDLHEVDDINKEGPDYHDL